VREHCRRTFAGGRYADRDIVARIERELLHDPVVVADKVTGKRLGLNGWGTVLSLVERHRRTVSSTVGEREVPINGFLYSRPKAGIAACLGIKADSTVSALMALAAGARPTHQGWTLTVYVDLQLVVVASDGEHRSLAHMLWGEPRVGVALSWDYAAPEFTRPTMVQALRWLEVERGRVVELTNTEAMVIERLHAEATPLERLALASFLRSTRERGGRLLAVLTERFEALRAIQGASWASWVRRPDLSFWAALTLRRLRA
jgi:hypothetical protein